MVKKLNTYGKILHVFTAFFPLYLYWAYFSFTKIESFAYKNLFDKWNSSFLVLCIFSVLSIFLFYYELLKNGKNHDKEINVKTSKKSSGHLRYIIGSFSPFILFLVDFITKAQQVSNTSTIVGTAFFILMGFILVFKEETGIMYNIFYWPYQILTVTTKQGKECVIITKKDSLSGHIKVTQLDKKVFKEWN